MQNRERGTWVLSRYTCRSSFIYYKRERKIERERGEEAQTIGGGWCRGGGGHGADGVEELGPLRRG